MPIAPSCLIVSTFMQHAMYPHDIMRIMEKMNLKHRQQWLSQPSSRPPSEGSSWGWISTIESDGGTRPSPVNPQHLAPKPLAVPEEQPEPPIAPSEADAYLPEKKSPSGLGILWPCGEVDALTQAVDQQVANATG